MSKMTNFDYNRGIINDILQGNEDFGVDKETMAIKGCDSLCCENCLFKSRYKTCQYNRFKWGMEEPTITTVKLLMPEYELLKWASNKAFKYFSIVSHDDFRNINFYYKYTGRRLNWFIQVPKEFELFSTLEEHNMYHIDNVIEHHIIEDIHDRTHTAYITSMDSKQEEK